MRSWFVPPRRRAAARAVEATPAQLVATGATGAGWDPLDQESGWRRAGSAGAREIPFWTVERARQYSIAAYRSNPMARAIVDTYVSFCVGDSGVGHQVSNPDVLEVVEQFWNDPRNMIGETQELGLRSCLLNGETLRELMVGPASGVVRYAPLDPAHITDVTLLHGNSAWPAQVVMQQGADERKLAVAAVDDATGLRHGECLFWTPFKTTETDVRSAPFMMPILDWLDSYDQVLSNLIDRTALARYMVWDVTIEGGQKDVDDFVRTRGGLHVPRSGSVEAHNQSVKWEPKHVETGAYEDTHASKSILTLVSAGAGLAKTWLADPEDANRDRKSVV